MKFAMGGDVLTTLTKKTTTSGDDLGALVRKLAAITEQLEGKVNGAGRAAFDAFQAQAENIAVELNVSLRGVLAGISEMDKSFQSGDQQIAEEISAAQNSSSFDAARFGTTKA